MRKRESSCVLRQVDTAEMQGKAVPDLATEGRVLRPINTGMLNTGMLYTGLLVGGLLLGGCGQQPNVPIPIQPSEPLPSTTKRSPTDFPTQWLGGRNITVAPGVHVLGDLYPSAAFAVETSQGLVLIDTGVEENCFLLRECLLSLGLRINEIKQVLITHAHYDHVFGTNRIREVSGATVCAGKDDCGVLRNADLDALQSAFPKHTYSGAAIEVDRELNDGDVIQLGDVTIRTISAPGHTFGSVCYLLEKDSQRILFSGDVIASLNFGPATYSAYISPKYRGDAESYLNTINRLLELEPPDLLLTGHPRQHRKLQTIRMDDQKWKELLEPSRKELEELVGRYKRDGADFLDGACKEIEPGLYYLGEVDGTAVYCIIDGQQRIVVNAPGGEQFSSFLTAQLETLGLSADPPNLVLLTSQSPETRSGLASLAPPPRVVAPETALESLRAEGIATVHQADLSEVAGFPIETIERNDYLCYSFPWNSKQVLVTPDVPRNIALAWRNRQNGQVTLSSLQPQTNDLLADLGASNDFAGTYREVLQQLSTHSPDIWLPAIPLVGQNANLYADDWQSILNENRRHAERREFQ